MSGISVTVRKAIPTSRAEKSGSPAAALQKRRLLVFEEAKDSGENFGVHGGGDAAGLCVLLAGVIDAKQAWGSGRDFGFCAVSEFEERAGSDQAALLEDVEVGVPADFAESEDCLGLQDFDLALEIAAAIENFTRERFILRRSAAACCGDVCVLKLQAILAVNGTGLIRKARFVQGSVEKIAGAVAGEHAPCAIRSVGGGGESENEQLRVRVAESRDRLAPILPLAIGTAFFEGDLFPVFHQTRALAASDDFFV